MRQEPVLLSDVAMGTDRTHCRRMYGASMRADDRRVISGIVQVLKSGCRLLRDCLTELWTSDNASINRFARLGAGVALVAKQPVSGALLCGTGRSTDRTQHGIDSSNSVKAHRSAAGGKGGSRSRLLGRFARRAQHEDTLHSQILKGAFSPSC